MSTVKMDPELKAKWVEALRSGDYKQTDGYLLHIEKEFVDFNDEDNDEEIDVPGSERFCCLGVLCDVMGMERDKFRENCTLDEVGVTILGGWDFPERKPDDPIETPTQRHLADMNDGGSDFAEIADYIEENL